MSESRLVHAVVSTQAIGELLEAGGDELHSDVTNSHTSHWGGFGLLSARKLRQQLFTSLPLLLGDIVGVALCLYTAAFITTLLGDWQIPLGLNNHLLAVCVAYVVVAAKSGLYPNSGTSPVYELRQQVSSIALSYLLMIAANGTVGEITFNEILTACTAVCLSAVVMPITRFIARHSFSRTSWWGQPIVVVGASQSGLAIHQFFKDAATRGFRPIGIVDESPEAYWALTADQPDAPPFLGTLDDFGAVCRQHNVFNAVAVVSDRDVSETQRVLSACRGIPNLIVLSHRMLQPSLWVQSCDFAGLSGIRIRDNLLSPASLIGKRIIDICVSSIVLVLALPLFFATAMVLRWKAPGPIFYGHPRMGRNGERFKAWKIRTMVTNADQVFEQLMKDDATAREEWNSTHKLKRDPRIIPGLIRLLRKSSLDELPQLWNVLKGEMSLVGPRPLPDDEIDSYSGLSLYRRVRPGLTGLWQVSGRNNTTYDDKVRFDSYYVRNWSLWLDYYILMRTFKTIVLGEGAY